ncbi:hypothetical protein CHUAL_002081 [Chamberlinius hualienensis]
MEKKLSLGFSILLYLTISYVNVNGQIEHATYKERIAMQNHNLNRSGENGVKSTAHPETETHSRFNVNVNSEASVPFHLLSSSSVTNQTTSTTNFNNHNVSNGLQSVMKSPSTNQSEEGQELLGQAQNFVPVTHFHNGPFHLPFRPQETQGPRTFRQILPQSFFVDGVPVYTGGHRGFHQPANSMQFRPIHHLRPQQRPFQQPQPIQPTHHQQFIHPDDLLHFPNAHHNNAATQEQHNDLLGSGNFNILSGGIFADPENPPAHFRQQLKEMRPTSEEDFFQSFRDFQPFSNALSVNHYKNMQHLPSNNNHRIISIIKPSEALLKKLQEEVLKSTSLSSTSPSTTVTKRPIAKKNLK